MSRSIWKQITAIALSAAAVCAIVTLTQPRATLEAADAPANAGRITVTGQGSVKVKPDIALVDLGVQAQNADAKAAQAANSERAAAVIAALKALGIKEADIQTSHYNLYPTYDYSAKGEARVTGYTVQNTINVTLRDINLVGEAIDAAIEAGANVSNGIRFTINDSGAYYAEALALAVAGAKQKALAIAGAMRVTVGNPIEVTENGGNYMPVAYENALMDSAVRAEAMPVQAGELEVTATITAVFTY